MRAYLQFASFALLFGVLLLLASPSTVSGTLSCSIQAGNVTCGNGATTILNLANESGGINNSHAQTWWWNSSFQSRMQVRFNTSNITEDLLNFPVMVMVNSSTIDYSLTQNGGQDIRFIDPESSTPLAYEIEKWNESGNSYVWVQVPNLTRNNTQDFIFMYYNNASAADAQNKATLWANYVSVWHLSEDKNNPDPAFKDSTSRHNGSQSADPQNAPGIIDGGVFFNATFSHSITAGTIDEVSNVTEAVIQGWMRRASTSGIEVLLGAESMQTFDIELYSNGNAYFQVVNASSGTAFVATNDVNWHHMAFIFNGSAATNATRLRGFMDGVEVSLTYNATVAQRTPLSANTGEFRFGRGLSTGDIDEPRVMNRTVSPEWIKAEYRTQANLMNSIGSAETQYANAVCCVESSALTFGTSCGTGGTTMLKLSATTNSHVEQRNESNYNVPACISATNSANSGNASCTYVDGACAAGYTCVLSIQNADPSQRNSTNDHLASCSAFTRNLCCQTNLNTVCVNETGVCYSTVQQAVTAAATGQTVIITDNATYNENLTINKRITLMGNATQGVATIWSINGQVTLMTDSSPLTLRRLNISINGTGASLDAITSANGNLTLEDMSFFINSTNGYAIRDSAGTGLFRLNVSRMNVSVVKGIGAVNTFGGQATFNYTRVTGNMSQYALDISGSTTVTLLNSYVNNTAQSPGEFDAGGPSGTVIRNSTLIGYGSSYPLVIGPNAVVDNVTIRALGSNYGVLFTANITLTNAVVTTGSGFVGIQFGAGPAFNSISYLENVTVGGGTTTPMDITGGTQVNITVTNVSSIGPSNTTLSSCTSCNITYRSFLDINATTSAGTGLGVATVNVSNRTGSVVLSVLTNSSGAIVQSPISYAWRTSATTITITNHTINITKSGFTMNGTTRNMSTNQVVSLRLSGGSVCINETGVCYSTIQQAMDAVTGNQTVVITDNATYNENVRFPDYRVTLTSNASAGYPTITQYNYSVINFSANAPNILKKLIINASGAGAFNVFITDGCCGISNLTLQDVHIWVNMSGGHIFDGTDSNLTLDRVNFTDVGYVEYIAYYCWNMDIRNSRFSAPNDWMIYCGSTQMTHTIQNSSMNIGLYGDYLSTRFIWDNVTAYFNTTGSVLNALIISGNSSISNSYVNNSDPSGRFYLVDGDNVTVRNSTFNGVATGTGALFLLRARNFTVIDSVINSYDQNWITCFTATSEGSATIINSTNGTTRLGSSAILFDTCNANFTFQSYLDVAVRDAAGGAVSTATVNVTPMSTYSATYSPTTGTHNATRGTLLEGTFTINFTNSTTPASCYTNLSTSDNSLCAQGGNASHDPYLLVNFTLPNATFESLYFTAEARSSAAGDSCGMALFNFTLGRWYRIANVTCGTSDVTQTVNLTAGISDFVSANKIQFMVFENTSALTANLSVDLISLQAMYRVVNTSLSSILTADTSGNLRTNATYEVANSTTIVQYRFHNVSATRANYGTNSSMANLSLNQNVTLILSGGPVCVNETGLCFPTVQQAIDNVSFNQTVIITDGRAYCESLNLGNNKNFTLTSNGSSYPTLYAVNTSLMYGQITGVLLSKFNLNATGTAAYTVMDDLSCCGEDDHTMNYQFSDISMWMNLTDATAEAFGQQGDQYVYLNRVNATLYMGNEVSFGNSCEDLILNNTRMTIPLGGILAGSCTGGFTARNSYFNLTFLLYVFSPDALYLDNVTAYLNMGQDTAKGLGNNATVRNTWINNTYVGSYSTLNIGRNSTYTNSTFIANYYVLGGASGSLGGDSVVSDSLIVSTYAKPILCEFAGSFTNVTFVNNSVSIGGAAAVPLTPNHVDAGSTCPSAYYFAQYLDAYVNDTLGNPVSGATVTAAETFAPSMLPLPQRHSLTSGALTEGTFNITTGDLDDGQCYENTMASDDARCQEDEGTANEDPYLIVNYTLPAGVVPTWIHFTAETRSSSASDSCGMALFNVSSGRWVRVANATCGVADVTQTYNLTSAVSQFISSQNRVQLMLYLNTTAVNGDLDVDYVRGLVFPTPQGNIVAGATTSASGYITRTAVPYAMATGLGGTTLVTGLTNHTINGSKSGYITNGTTRNMTTNQNVTITLTSDPCSQTSGDLTVTSALTCTDTWMQVNTLIVSGNLSLVRGNLSANRTIITPTGRFDAHNTRTSIWQNGNLTIAGSYTLDNATLRMNGTSVDGAIGIQVNASGTMVLGNGSTVTNGQTTGFDYFFRVNGTLNSSFSFINSSGWASTDGSRGLTIYGKADINSTNITSLHTALHVLNTSSIRYSNLSGTNRGVRASDSANTSFIYDIFYSSGGIAFDELGTTNSVKFSNLTVASTGTYALSLNDEVGFVFSDNYLQAPSGIWVISSAQSRSIGNSTINVTSTSGNGIEAGAGAGTKSVFSNLTITTLGQGFTQSSGSPLFNTELRSTAIYTYRNGSAINITGGRNLTFDMISLRTVGNGSFGIYFNGVNDSSLSNLSANKTGKDSEIVSLYNTNRVNVTTTRFNITSDGGAGLGLYNTNYTTVRNGSWFSNDTFVGMVYGDTNRWLTIQNTTIYQYASSGSDDAAFRIANTRDSIFEGIFLDTPLDGFSFNGLVYNDNNTISNTTIDVSRFGIVWGETNSNNSLNNVSVFTGNTALAILNLRGLLVRDSLLDSGTYSSYVSTASSDMLYINTRNVGDIWLVASTSNMTYVNSTLNGSVLLGGGGNGAYTTNVTFLNTTGTVTTTNCDGTPLCYFYQQWYVLVNVTNASGSAVSGATVNFTNRTGTGFASVSTSALGLSGLIPVTQYYVRNTVNSTTQNTTITASTSASSATASRNVTFNAIYNLTVIPGTPTQGTPIVNASDNPLNSTTATLTCWNQTTADPNGDSVTNTYVWYVNGSTHAVGQYPFNTQVTTNASGAIKDYAGGDNNGTLGNGTASAAPTWTANGKGGGAYAFDGVNDVINLGDMDAVDNATRIAVMAWVRSAAVGGAGTEVHILDKSACTGNSNTGVFELFAGYNFAGKARFTVYPASAPDVNISGPSLTSIDDASWHHVAGVYDGNTMYLYVDGALETSTVIGAITLASNTHPVEVGGACSGYTGGSGPFWWNGSIDDVRIYNRSLSAEQIAQIYAEGAGTMNRSSIVGQETTRGDTWACTVTPSDGIEDGANATSNTLTIRASRPNIPTLVTPTNGDTTVTSRYPAFTWTVTDNDSDTVTSYWNVSSPATCAAIPEHNTTTQTYTSVDKLCVDRAYNWTVYGCDVDGCSAQPTRFNFTITSVVGIVFINNTVNFGSLGISTVGTPVSANTTGNSPLPLVYNNTGNVDINVSARANAALWSTQGLSTQYFQFVDQNNSTWQSFTSGYTLVTSNLTYLSAARELDILVEVPVGEPSGAKNTTITVLGASRE